jgi:hypothetical protein
MKFFGYDYKFHEDLFFQSVLYIFNFVTPCITIEILIMDSEHGLVVWISRDVYQDFPYSSSGMLPSLCHE